MKRYFEIIEDNGGGLHFYAFNEEQEVIYGAEHLEQGGNAKEMILGFLNGGNPEEWEGIDNPAESYESLTSHEYGWEMVAEGEYCTETNTSRVSYVIDTMGASAQDSLF